MGNADIVQAQHGLPRLVHITVFCALDYQQLLSQLFSRCLVITCVTLCPHAVVGGVRLRQGIFPQRLAPSTCSGNTH